MPRHPGGGESPEGGVCVWSAKAGLKSSNRPSCWLWHKRDKLSWRSGCGTWLTLLNRESCGYSMDGGYRLMTSCQPRLLSSRNGSKQKASSDTRTWIPTSVEILLLHFFAELNHRKMTDYYFKLTAKLSNFEVFMMIWCVVWTFNILIIST